MRIVAATTDEEMLHTIIGAQILGGTMDYRGFSNMKGFEQFRAACPDEPENAPVPEDDVSDESPAVQTESAPVNACNAPDLTPGEQSATLQTADSYSFADGFETKIGRQNCRPIRMWTGGQSIFIPP